MVAEYALDELWLDARLDVGGETWRFAAVSCADGGLTAEAGEARLDVSFGEGP